MKKFGQQAVEALVTLQFEHYHSFCFANREVHDMLIEGIGKCETGL